MTTTLQKTMLALVVAVGLGALVAACGDDGGGNGGGTPDMAMQGGGDMAGPACSMNPMTHEELLNACTTAQTGDPSKDAPYYPTLAPNGQLPPLP
jgi:hypothetical protein